MWYYLIIIQLTANAHAIASNLGEYKGKEACMAAATAVTQSSNNLNGKALCVPKGS
jgi:hypothetical protein